MNRRTVYWVLAGQVLGVAVFALLWDALDFRIYWLGGKAVGDDARLYLEQQAEHWFTYPPFAAVVFKGMGWLPLTAARVVWQLASVAALGWACHTMLRMAGLPAGGRTLAGSVAAGLLLEPVWHTLFLGQINLFLLALVLADLRRAFRGDRCAGVGTGLAAAVKLTPVIFVALLVVTGRFRAAGTALATIGACTLLAWAVAPDASAAYWSGLFHDTSRVGASYIANQSPFGGLARLLGGPEEVGAWYLAVPLVLGTLGLAVARRAGLDGDTLKAVAVTGVTGLLVSPISWTHHWVWALPALVLLHRDGRGAALAWGYGLLLLAPPWSTPKDGGPDEYGFHGLMTLAANSYTVAGLAFLVAAAWPDQSKNLPRIPSGMARHAATV